MTSTASVWTAKTTSLSDPYSITANNPVKDPAVVKTIVAGVVVLFALLLTVGLILCCYRDRRPKSKKKNRGWHGQSKDRECVEKGPTVKETEIGTMSSSENSTKQDRNGEMVTIDS